MNKLPRLIEDYVKEACSIQSHVEIERRIATGQIKILPIIVDFKEVGFLTWKLASDDILHWPKDRVKEIGLEYLTTEQLGNLKVAVVESVYLEPQYRGNFFFSILPDIARIFKSQGIDLIKTEAKMWIAKWLEYRYKAKPFSITYIGTPDALIPGHREDA